MKIKIDLAAFKALTQEQIEALADAQKGHKAEDVVRSMGDGLIRWDWSQYELAVSENSIRAYCAFSLDEVRWATIEKLAEYNVITFQP